MTNSTKRLWAPWRLEYIQGPRDQVCPFCEAPKEEPSEENLVLFRNADLSVMMNKFPYNPGHLLIVPRAHVGFPSDLPQKVWNDLSVATRACVELLKKSSNPPGFNIGMNVGAVGGAGLPDHLHWHLLPRWSGDTNFMPLLAETKTLPVHNRTVYQQLRPLFDTFATYLARGVE